MKVWCLRKCIKMEEIVINHVIIKSIYKITLTSDEIMWSGAGIDSNIPAGVSESVNLGVFCLPGR